MRSVTRLYKRSQLQYKMLMSLVGLRSEKGRVGDARQKPRTIDYRVAYELMASRLMLSYIELVNNYNYEQQKHGLV
jgi:hypothetical protein